MPDYRFYLLIATSGRIHSARDIEAAGDEDAIQIAGALLEDKSIEIWCGGRKVHRLETPAPAILERHRAHVAGREFEAAGGASRGHYHG